MATLQEQLADAKAKYHRLMTGTAVVELKDQNGETVRYTPANSAKLAAYIKGLSDEVTPPPTAGIGPMRIFI